MEINMDALKSGLETMISFVEGCTPNHIFRMNCFCECIIGEYKQEHWEYVQHEVLFDIFGIEVPQKTADGELIYHFAENQKHENLTEEQNKVISLFTTNVSRLNEYYDDEKNWKISASDWLIKAKKVLETLK